MLLIYLSGTILFVGLETVEQVGVDLYESESDTVKDNEHERVKHQIQKTGPHFYTYLQNLHTYNLVPPICSSPSFVV